jgi:hypothetical protein
MDPVSCIVWKAKSRSATYRFFETFCRPENTHNVLVLFFFGVEKEKQFESEEDSQGRMDDAL